MENLTIENLLELLKKYDESDKEMIKKAYEYANYLHEGQFRQSGEPYISHPLNVAYILAEMHADRDTICAALLHDTLEDRPDEVSKEEIAKLFNQDVAELVDGVTKISKMNFSSKAAQNSANTRKIITSLTQDVRIIIIKLADRLHNMRTLQYKTEFKQKENALETLEIFVPLAYLIGAYRIKSELEDLSMQYLYPEEYKKNQHIMNIMTEDSKECINEMLIKIKKILNDRCIPNEIKVRMKNIYGIYKRKLAGHKISDIHDLVAFKIMVEEVDSCYLLLRPIHEAYKPVPGKFKDFICNPKTNMYQSLHTTVFAPDDRLVQMQLRTFDMDKIASFGLTAYWNLQQGDARKVMQEDLKNKCQFYRSLLEINHAFGDNQEFVLQAKNELFSDKIYVYTTKGEIIELPKGATIIDFAYKIHTDIGNTMIGAFVNDEYLSVNDVLKNENKVLRNKDRVRIITDKLNYGPTIEWEQGVKTTYAKRRIREFCGKLSSNNNM